MSTSATTNVSQDISQRTQSLMQQSIQPLSSPSLVHSSLPPITVTFTDVVYTTIDSTDSLIPVTVSDTPSQQIPTDDVTPVVNHSNNIDPWTHRLHQLLPFLGVFAVIGLLAVLLMLCFLGYRFVSAGGGGRRRQRHRRHRHSVDYDNIDINNHEQLQEKSNRGACWTRTKSQQPSPQQSSPIIFQEPIPARLRQYFRNDSSVSDENYNQPISNTFVPLETSPMTLVDRRDILQDPIRKRGVDELAMWEKKQKQRQLYSMQDYPESPDVLQPSSASSSETVQPLALSPITNTVHSPLPTSEKSPPLPSHVALARYALQKSHLHNSSSQWLQPSGSSKSF